MSLGASFVVFSFYLFVCLFIYSYEGFFLCCHSNKEELKIAFLIQWICDSHANAELGTLRIRPNGDAIANTDNTILVSFWIESFEEQVLRGLFKPECCAKRRLLSLMLLRLEAILISM